jgi:hypothetical protein
LGVRYRPNRVICAVDGWPALPVTLRAI